MPNNNLIRSNELYHYGVLGMKWGHRKARPQVSLNPKVWRSNIKRAGGFAKATRDGHRLVRKELSNKKTTANKKSMKQVPFQKKIGKAAVNKIQKNKAKRAEHDAKIKKTTDRFGTGGVMISTVANSGRKFVTKKIAANVLNSAANAYISSSKGNYYTKRGADLIRKAGIGALSVSVYADQIRGARDIAKSYEYARSKRK